MKEIRLLSKVAYAIRKVRMLPSTNVPTSSLQTDSQKKTQPKHVHKNDSAYAIGFMHMNQEADFRIFKNLQKNEGNESNEQSKTCYGTENYFLTINILLRKS